MSKVSIANGVVLQGQLLRVSMTTDESREQVGPLEKWLIVRVLSDSKTISRRKDSIWLKSFFYPCNSSCLSWLLHSSNISFLTSVHGKSQNSGWFAPFRLGSFKKQCLWFEAMQLFYSWICSSDLYIRCGGSFSHHLKFYSFMHNYFSKSKTFWFQP